MIRKYYEVDCDRCGLTDHFPLGRGRAILQMLREEGWIVTSKGKHYCSNKCHAIMSKIWKMKL